MSPAIGTVRYLDAETAIVDADGRLLLIEQERPSGRQWRLPGGGVEPGDSMAEAAVREARGETGLTVRIGRQPIGRFDLCREAWPLDLVEPMLRRIEPFA